MKAIQSIHSVKKKTALVVHIMFCCRVQAQCGKESWLPYFLLYLSQMHVRTLIQAGGSSSVVRIEAGSLIDAGSPMRAGGSNSKRCQPITVVYILRYRWRKYTWQNRNGLANMGR